MAASFDAYDVQAFEKSVNESAVRVSTIWVSFLVFGLYLVVAAANVTHRQLLLQDPVKLPLLNIELPLIGFFFLAPALFVVLHYYVLLQVLLLSRTAAAYNEAVEHNIANASDRARVRQRLSNTLFAQIFAGSSREREGLVGALLRLMAWITLAIAPVLVLLTFEVQFLPYHGSLVTWSHRGLVAIDVAGVLLLWRGVLNAQQDITWRRLTDQRSASLTAGALLMFSIMVVTFPGERHTTWMRFGKLDPRECNGLMSISVFADHLSLPREVLIDEDRLSKIENAANAAGQKANEGERTRHFEGRDLSCGRFIGADLRRASFAGPDTNLRGAVLENALLQGADLRGTLLQDASLSGAQLQGASFSKAQLQGAKLVQAQLKGVDLGAAELRKANLTRAQLQETNLRAGQLQEADLGEAQLQGADLYEAQLQGANLFNAHLQGAVLFHAKLQGASLFLADLVGTDLRYAQLQGADLRKADFGGASLALAELQGADLRDARLLGAGLREAQLQGADLRRAGLWGADLRKGQLQGTNLEGTILTLADVSHASLWRASGASCDTAWVIAPQFDRVVAVNSGSPPQSTAADIEAFIERLVGATPEPERQTLRSNLRARLIEDTIDDGANEQAWRACAARASNEENYIQEQVNYLLDYVCGIPREEESRRTVLEMAKGFYNTWIFSRTDSHASALAQGLRGRGRKACPNAEEIEGSIKEMLKKKGLPGSIW